MNLRVVFYKSTLVIATHFLISVGLQTYGSWFTFSGYSFQKKDPQQKTAGLRNIIKVLSECEN